MASCFSGIRILPSPSLLPPTKNKKIWELLFTQLDKWAISFTCNSYGAYSMNPVSKMKGLIRIRIRNQRISIRAEKEKERRGGRYGRGWGKSRKGKEGRRRRDGKDRGAEKEEEIPSVEGSNPMRLHTDGYNILKNWFFSKSNQNLKLSSRDPNNVLISDQKSGG